MKVRQLQYLCEIARQRCNISAAAAALHTAQPGISKQIQLLEKELGTRIFLRAGNRLSGLTSTGEKILESAARVITEIAYINTVSREQEKSSGGILTIATTHTQARYVLPAVMKRFTERHPRVRVTLRHGNPARILELLRSGEAQLGVTTNAPGTAKDLIVLPSHQFERVVIVPGNHPLLRERQVTLKSLARHPMVTYDSGFTGRDEVLKSFERAGLTPNLVLSASDADVIKSCVEHGLGIAVLLGVTYDAERDKGLKAIPADHLFPAAKISVVIHRRHYLRAHEYDFIEMLSARWNRSSVQQAAGL